MMSIAVGDIEIENRVFLAPMSGVTDAPYRRLAARAGAGLVVTEMVASADLVKERHDVVMRARGGDGITPFVVQLAGREARWMGEAAKLACGRGARIIDINMGCPARKVTGSYSGSALMRDLDHALTLIEATVNAVDVPVTLKMRLGWDERSMNAPELARRAEATGIRMVTVHGRTRCQFFEGRADWAAIARIKQAVSIPVIANGDMQTIEDVRRALRLSGADGVMVGRGAYGRPWLPGALSAALNGSFYAAPGLDEQRDLVQEHYDGMLHHYGRELGVRCARKHLGWYVEQVAGCARRFDRDEVKAWRRKLCQDEDAAAVKRNITNFYQAAAERAAA